MYVVYFFFVYLSHLNFLSFSFSLLRAWGFGSETANNCEVRRQQKTKPRDPQTRPKSTPSFLPPSCTHAERRVGEQREEKFT